MAQKRATRARSAGQPRDADDDRAAARSEEIHVRSYAHERAHDLRVAVIEPDGGEVVFESEYFLQPGDADSETDALPAGEYEVRAALDGDKRTTARCRIGSAPDRTAVIEVGNGVLSLTEGLPTR